MAGRRWTAEEENYLRENHIDMTCEEIGKVIGRTTKSTQHKYGQMGLERPQPDVGETVGNFTILEKWIEHNGRQNRTMVKCRCKCDHETIQALTTIVNGFTENCEECHQEKLKELGIFQKTHGDSGTRLHKIWLNMRGRCMYKSVKLYYRYGGRGIKVCDEWNNRETGYAAFKAWAISAGYEDHLTIDRMDNDGNYTPENCRWITLQDQLLNTSRNVKLTLYEETKTIAEWCRDPRLPNAVPSIVAWRYRKGWTDEECLLKPIRKMTFSNEKAPI